MLLDVCLGTRSVWKILFVLSEAPGKAVSRKEIKNLTKLGNKVIVKFLDVLMMYELVTTKKIGKTTYYTLNLSHTFAHPLLTMIQQEKKELNNINFKILNVIREFVYELTNVSITNIQKVILFGSHAKRTATESSDIDIALVVVVRNPSDELLISEICEKLKKRFKKEIQPHYFTLKEFGDIRKKIIFEIQKDGVVLV